MTSLGRYYSAHLRSLFISKFHVRSCTNILPITCMRWVFLTKPTFFPLVSLLCYLLTGQWPMHKRINRYIRGSRSASTMLSLSVRYGQSFESLGLRLLHKLKMLYLPYVDSALMSADSLFDAFFLSSSSVMANWKLVILALPELESLIGSNLSVVQSCAKYIDLKCIFSGNDELAIYGLLTSIRALQFPLASSTSFERAYKNSSHC